jgi:hypothetical protein
MAHMGHNDTGLRARIEATRERSLRYFDTLQAPFCPRGVSRISPAHDVDTWPGMLLPGTYNTLMCRDLLDSMDGVDRAGTAAWMLTHRSADGVFRIPGMRETDVFKKPDVVETRRYIDFHVTNYSLGGLQALGDTSPPVLDFVAPFLDPLALKAWLAERDLRDPWQEGNNIVNLGSFLLLLGAAGMPALEILFAWHDRLQEPATGFWGVGQSCDETAALHAMAGSMHNFHLWYATGRQLAYQTRAMDYALSRPAVVHSACIDVDLVDLLIHGLVATGHRREHTHAWLRRLLPALLDLQNDDGGFPDMRVGTWRQDGWVRGYGEPQGLSNGFATWFRWIAIAMIADTLWPGWRAWRFRRMVGIGYRGRVV